MTAATGPGIYNTDAGCNSQFVLASLGPSLGWAMLPVQPELCERGWSAGGPCLRLQDLAPGFGHSDHPAERR
jgi:hypothetical protein